jgi:hypothetical protein
MKRCILIQGPTDRLHIQENKKCWKNYDIIFSTWVDSDKTAYDTTDTILYNEYPISSHPNNWGLQRVSTLNGIVLAKELGYDRVLKWRSDFKTNNAKNLLNLFDIDKFNFYSFIDQRGGYITDFFMEGNINEMYNIFNTAEGGEFPERILTTRVYELGLDKKSNFICNSLNAESNIYWHKYSYWFTENIPQPQYLNYIKK